MINVSFEGVVVDDPTFKITNSGVAMANIRVAINERVKDKETGEWRDGDSTYLTVMAWKNMAENATDTFKRGDRIVVIGKQKERRWTDKDGNERTSYEVTADSLGASIKFAPVATQKRNNSGKADSSSRASRSDKADSSSDWEAPF